jgi:Holliday junction resolvase-like predicted endonuclease
MSDLRLLAETLDGFVDYVEPPIGLSRDDVAKQIAESTPWSSDCEVIDLGELRWRPDLCKGDGQCVLLIHLATEFRPHLIDRLNLARQAEKQVVVAVPKHSLYREQLLKALAEIGVSILVLDERGAPISEQSRSLLRVVSDLSIPVAPELRTHLAHIAWGELGAGDAYRKGRRFEDLLSFLFNQVADFEVVERNYRSETDEIDLVIQLRRWSKRLWHRLDSPIVLVEAKNWSDRVDQPAVSNFGTKLDIRSPSVRIGFLITKSSITRDARLQVLRMARETATIVLMDGEALQEWIESSDPDAVLERLLRDGVAQ